MELKNKKTKARSRGKLNIIADDNNTDTFIERDESVFLQGVEIKDDLLDISNNDSFNKNNNRKKFLFTYLPWVLLIILLIISFFLWFQLIDIKKDPLRAVKAETAELVNIVGKIMVLPKDESPKIATLTEEDLDKIKTQPFFINANVGDKVLVYSIARKVILYNPASNKIVEVSNLNSDNNYVPQPSF